IAAGKATTVVVSAKVASLTHGVLKTMVLVKVKLAALVLLTLGVIGSSVGLVGYGSDSSDQPGSGKASTSTPSAPLAGAPPAVDAAKEKDDLEQELKKAAHDLAAVEIQRQQLLKDQQVLQFRQKQLEHTQELLRQRLQTRKRDLDLRAAAAQTARFRVELNETMK